MLHTFKLCMCIYYTLVFGLNQESTTNAVASGVMLGLLQPKQGICCTFSPADSWRIRCFRERIRAECTKYRRCPAAHTHTHVSTLAHVCVCVAQHTWVTALSKRAVGWRPTVHLPENTRTNENADTATAGVETPAAHPPAHA